MIGTVQGYKEWAAAQEDDAVVAPDIVEATLEAASELVAALCGRRFEVIEDASEIVMGSGSNLLPIPDFVQVDVVTEAGAEIDPNTYRVEPQNDIPRTVLVRRWALWSEGIEYTVTGDLGYRATVPASVRAAVYMIVQAVLSGEIGLASLREQVLNTSTQKDWGAGGVIGRLSQFLTPHRRASIGL